MTTLVPQQEVSSPYNLEELIEIDRSHVWHPFTQMQEWVEDEDPLIIARGKGPWLMDVQGRRYLDGVSSLWVQVHGHRKAQIDEAVRNQLDQIAHSTMLGLSNVPATLLAKRLIDVAPPGLSRVFYSDNGSTAMEVAVKMSFQYWSHQGRPKKNKFIRLKDAYHGDTLGSVSVGGMELFHQTFAPLLFDSIEAPNPFGYRCPLGAPPDECADVCGDALEALIRDRGHEVAALVLEPLVQGAAGMIVYPESYLRRARALCDEHDILLIADEVATGFGRTGSMFACERAEISPDLMAVAKGLTGGYLPLAATLTTEKVYKAFLGAPSEVKTFFHGHTYTGNPLAAAAAVANLDLFEEEQTIENLQPKIQRLQKNLEPLVDYPFVGDVRQCGFMVGIELVSDKTSKEPFAMTSRIGAKVCRAARDEGVLLRPLGDVVVLMPPLCLNNEEIDQLVRSVYYGIEKATQRYRV